MFNAQSNDLCFPLMALVDYRGFRLIAISLLPIDKNTIIYGSNDYGKTIHQTNNSVFINGLKKSSMKLNIKPHQCGNSTVDPRVVYGIYLFIYF
jgi:hypothetical protein